MASPLLLVIGYCMFCAFTMCREMWMDGGRARAARVPFESATAPLMTDQQR